MTKEEVKAAKKEAEGKIATVIMDLMKATGFVVTQVRIEMIDISNKDTPPPSTIVGPVNITLTV